ncbi:MAG TPA: Gfo/Idh/MocA family oxidoreductase [Candidatus Hydrogenedentes bacterium]|nr:Gfo/Idh/MocA family oxidoreductase [Candidatus Hydrogenedentota bacterium]
MSEQKWTRRAFLAAATTTAVAIAGGCSSRPNTAKVVPGKESPNEKLNVAGVGVGGKGTTDIMSCRREGANIVALCDPDWDQAGEAFYRLKNAKQYKDYRKMLDEMGKEIDACTISTPDHTHAPAAYMAMKLGKHVYVQKPLTHTIAEAYFLRKVAAETKVKTQMGNQGHCGDGVRELCEMVWAGALGDVKEAHVWTDRPLNWWPQGIPDPLPEEPIPPNMDWDLWIGTAPMRPYNKGYAPFKWRGWWDFGCGAIGDMACHIMDPTFWALKLGEAKSFKVEVVTQEGLNTQTGPTKSIIKYTFPQRAGLCPVEVYWYDGGLLPKRPDGVPEKEKLGDGENGSFFIGTKGAMTSGCYGDESRLLPESRMKDYKRPIQTLKRIKKESPYVNWLDACKGGEEACSNFEYAVPLTVVANMGNVALRAGKAIEFNVKEMRVTNDKDANMLLTKTYRKGWELPV